MYNAAVFLDRDGTINKVEETEDPVFVTSYDKFEFYPDVIDAIKILNALGLKVIITTNQPSIARGLCTESDVDNLHRLMLNDLKKAGAHIDAVYFCPHHPETHHKDIRPEFMKYRIECECRKPNIGMLRKAAKEFGIDLRKSFAIGDRTVDIQNGKNAGCKTILVTTGMAGKDGKYNVGSDFVCDSLLDAVSLIERNITTKAVILAGGRGERLRPLTDLIPKPMIEIAGKPLLQHQIEVLKKNGITEIVLCGSYLVEKIKDYFGDGVQFGVKIYYPDEPEQLGSGGAVKNAQEFLKDTKRFIIINGDKMIGPEFDFSTMLNYDAGKNGFATLLVRETDHPLDSDILKLDNSNKVVEFIGRGQDVHKISNSGIIVAKPSLLEFIPEGKSNIERDVVFRLIRSKDIYGFMLPKEWFVRDIGTHEGLNKAKNHFEKVS
jgi:histidinol-phosphate phosphatase family protein